MNVVNAETDWLSLSEYSSEYGVSVSTLRRRIKNKKVKFKQIHGKYFLPKQELSPSPNAFTPVPASNAFQAQETSIENHIHQSQSLLDELKKAYMQTLQSKEDQIIQLKQQISDLKTLVMYLEKEKDRLEKS